MGTDVEDRIAVRMDLWNAAVLARENNVSQDTWVRLNLKFAQEHGMVNELLAVSHLVFTGKFY